MNFTKTAGKYNIPCLSPVKSIDDNVEFMPFNFVKTSKDYTKGVHFFIDDYQFNRLWTKPDVYCKILKDFKYVLSPDFSLYADIPYVMQLWKHYQKQWFGCYMQKQGIEVIPTIGWADERSFKFCFEGIPKHSVVAVSSVGTQANRESKELFQKGFKRAMRVLKPTQVVFFGKLPEWIDSSVNIRHIPHYFDVKFKNMKYGR
ncbi:MAG: DUF4417 domain-containing protein [Prevotellaceae bacterium]|nr:DUF4417 domain-containing protein [Prevotellaceae bacterium]